MKEGLNSGKETEVMSRDYVTVFGTEVVQETEKAILVKMKNQGEHWIPKSQIKSKVTIGKTVELSIPEWLADEKEIMY